MNHADHATRATAFNRDPARVDWHDQTLWLVREKRDRAAHSVPDWEALRETASQIKHQVLAHLDELLVAFETNATAHGVQVHWAETAEEHNQIVHKILLQRGANRVVKSKSMLTEECHLNPFLKDHGIEVIDTDLGERIVQLAEETPSHIVLPCIHKKKEEIGVLFHAHLGTPSGNSDPDFLANAARVHLRDKLLAADVAITGVNFAVADTGEIIVCTNEGNADLGVQLAGVHIACMGIEKIIPRQEDLGVFLRLLARSATGQPVTSYSSHFRRPATGKEMHVILVDNGRSKRLGEEKYRNALKCIRCGACFNTCPVYRRSGGHSYHSVIAGPLGSILAPAWNRTAHADLPFASTLCGSCSNVCPVKINIHEQLYLWRQDITASSKGGVKKTGITFLNWIFSRVGRYTFFGSLLRGLLKYFPLVMRSPWTVNHRLPSPPPQTFRAWYKNNRKR